MSLPIHSDHGPPEPEPGAGLLDQEARDKAHGLADGIVYGPVPSRRYGMTYGVNLLPPAEKRCDWNCVYCQLGYSDYGEAPPGGYPSPGEVSAALRGAPDVVGLGAIVICGNGEPTLHPELPGVIDALVAARDVRFPGVPLTMLTNGAEVWRRPVRQALLRLDEVAVKLDAGTCETLHKINLPSRGACVETQIRNAKRLRGAVVQTCFFEGPVQNSDEREVRAWIRAVERAMPRRVDIYTLSRSTPSRKLRPVPDERLSAIGAALREATGVEVRVFGADAQL